MFSSKLKISYVFLVIFIVVITSLRLLWINLFYSPHIFSEQGEISFGSEVSNQIHYLDGNWDFYPSQFISPEQLSENPNFLSPKSIKVPGVWNEGFGDKQPKGYGTYVLNITLPDQIKESLGFYFPSIRSASKIYINNNLVHQSGTIAADEKKAQAKNLPQTIIYHPDQSEHTLQVVVQVSNYKDSRGGGIVRGVQFGTADLIINKVSFSKTSQLLTIMFFYLISFLTFLLYLVTSLKKNRKEFRLFYFAILLASLATIFFLSSDEKMLHQWTSISYEWGFSFVNALQILAGIAILKILIFSFKANNKWLNHAIIFGYLLIVISLVVPNIILTSISIIYSLYLFVSIVVLIKELSKGLNTKKSDSILFIFSIISLTNHLLWWFYSISTGLSLPHYPIDLLLALSFIIAAWFEEYTQVINKLLILNKKVIETNQQKDDFVTLAVAQMTKPLQSLLTINQHLMTTNLSENQKQELAQANVINTHLGIVIKNLADVIRANTNEEQVEFTAIPVEQSISSIQSIIEQYFIEKKRVTFSNNENEPLTILGHRDLFFEMLYNIYYYAYNNTPSNSEMIIHSQKKTAIQKGNIIIELTNYKMSPTSLSILDMSYDELIEHNHLFSDELQIELNLANKLAQVQGGQMDVHIHDTSTFIQLEFELSTKEADLFISPIQERTFSPTWQTSLKSMEQTHSKVLIIGKNDLHTNVLEHLLNKEHYETHSTTCEEEASDLLMIDNWDLVIIDPYHPEINFYQWIRETRKYFTLVQLPILYLSNWGKLNENHLAFQAGANDFIEKPIDGQELLVRVNTLTLMKKTVDQTIELEAAWLQSQISPHFLFNTLNTIISLQRIDEEKMENVLDAFMNVLHNKFKYKGLNETISLKEEIEMVQSYLYIEQQRFGERLNVRYAIDPVELDSIAILPLTIQPLVENAVKHGILPNKEGGTLTLKIIDSPTFVTIEVQDDGTGMTEEEIQTLLKNEFEITRGIGVVNTNIRLQKYFHTQLEIDSSIGVGTTFRFHLPKN